MARNIIDQIKAFEGVAIKTHPLNANAARLWYRINWELNAARWTEKPIYLSEVQLSEPCGLSHASFLRARKQLMDLGYVYCYPQGANRSPAYLVRYLPEHPLPEKEFLPDEKLIK